MRVDASLVFWGMIVLLSVLFSAYFLHHVSGIDWYPYVLVDRGVVSDIARISYVLGLLTGLYSLVFLYFIIGWIKRRGLL